MIRDRVMSFFEEYRANIKLWFDSYDTSSNIKDINKVQWIRILPLIGLHMACLGVIFVGYNEFVIFSALLFFWLRMFFITAFYHRYFSHRAFKTSRISQFIFAILGHTSLQRGALWWAAHHRKHHKESDQGGDEHSPCIKGFIWSHILWFTTEKNRRTQLSLVKDWAKFPELVFLDRYALLVPVVLFGIVFFSGLFIERYIPQLETTVWQWVVWVYIISTVFLMHATYTINSLAHLWGKRNFVTHDNSRNNLFLALLTLGEGWHNNHHFFPASARQGFFKNEIDITYAILKVMQHLGIIWDLKTVPENILMKRLPLTKGASL